jgi:hypothetical protein
MTDFGKGGQDKSKNKGKGVDAKGAKIATFAT